MITAANVQARYSFLDCLTLEDGTDRSSGNVGTTTNTLLKFPEEHSKVVPLPVVQACWVIGGVFPLVLNLSIRVR